MNIRSEVLRLASLGKGQRTIAKELGITRWRVRQCLKGTKDHIFKERTSKQFKPTTESYLKNEGDDDDRIVDAFNIKRIKTLEDLKSVCEIDEKVWDIHDYIENAWEVTMKGPNYQPIVSTNFQVKAFMRKKKEQLYVNQIKDDILSLISKYPSETPNKEYFVSSYNYERNMLEIAIYDIHLGQHTWHEETGQDYDIKIAEALFKWSVQQHLYKARHTKIDKIVFVVGNDFYHIDNEQNTTTHGTQLQADTRWLKVIRTGFRLVTWACSEMLKVAPVELVVVPGNHDWHSTLALGEMLSIYYEHNNVVDVDNRPLRRKYLRYGTALIGFGHGNKEKPQKIIGAMPQEANALWTGAKYTEMHCGHYHHQKVLDPVVEYNGIVLRYIPTICATDSWHSENVFTGNTRTSQSFVWNAETGLEQINFANLKPDLQQKG